MFMHTFCKYVFVKSYADKILWNLMLINFCEILC